MTERFHALFSAQDGAGGFSGQAEQVQVTAHQIVSLARYGELHEWQLEGLAALRSLGRRVVARCLFEGFEYLRQRAVENLVQTIEPALALEE